MRLSLSLIDGGHLILAGAKLFLECDLCHYGATEKWLETKNILARLKKVNQIGKKYSEDGQYAFTPILY